jgi:invasion protein IalB
MFPSCADISIFPATGILPESDAHKTRNSRGSGHLAGLHCRVNLGDALPMPFVIRQVLLLAGVLAASFSMSSAFAQGAVKGTHGDWQVRCETPPGAKSEQCALVQNVAAEDRPTVTLLVIVLRTADQKSRLLRVVAPLGVLLPSGLGLKIDDKDIGRAGFVRCLNTGCVAEVVIDDALLGQLKTGQNATFIVFQTPEEGIGIPVSLNGFAKGVESLQ